MPIPSLAGTPKARPKDPAATSATIPQQTLPQAAAPVGTADQGTVPSAVTATTVTSVPASGWVAGPGSGLSLGHPAQGTPPLTISASAIDPAVVKAAGLHGVAFSLHRDDGGNAVAAVAAKIDVNAYKYAFGADWASRVKFTQYPVCVLTTPDVPACSTPEPVTSSTDQATSTVTATVSVDSDPGAASADPGGASTSTATLAATDAVAPAQTDATAGLSATVLVAQAAAAGPAGDFTASTLSPSWNWSQSGNSGAFTYDYNVPAPAVDRR